MELLHLLAKLSVAAHSRAASSPEPAPSLRTLLEFRTISLAFGGPRTSPKPVVFIGSA